MESGAPRRRHARPVADAPIDALLPRVDDIAKGWLLALLEQTELDRAPELLASDLVHDGPHICEAVLRALADERELRRIEPGGSLEGLVARTGELAGARRASESSRAVDVLHAVLWRAVRDELVRPEAEQVSELAERLVLVIESVRGAAVDHCDERPPTASHEGGAARSIWQRVHRRSACSRPSFTAASRSAAPSRCC
ncbi:MAG: hypothetical protein ABSG43_05690 [Solirubrobacteraceae bacterium]